MWRCLSVWFFLCDIRRFRSPVLVFDRQGFKSAFFVSHYLCAFLSDFCSLCALFLLLSLCWYGSHKNLSPFIAICHLSIRCIRPVVVVFLVVLLIGIVSFLTFAVLHENGDADTKEQNSCIFDSIKKTFLRVYKKAGKNIFLFLFNFHLFTPEYRPLGSKCRL